MATGNSTTNSWQATMKRPKRGVPEGLWQRCPGCQATIFRKEAEKRFGVCPECNYQLVRVGSGSHRQMLDEGTFEEWDADLQPLDPLCFADKKPYRERLIAEQARAGLKEAAIVGTGMIRARRVAIGVTDSAFIMGSMGAVVGEKLTRTIERATEQKLPLDYHKHSGGGVWSARRHLVADANGQGLGRPGPLRPVWRTVYLGADQSDHGRRGGQLCLAGRPDLCRTQGPDRFRRSADDSSNDSHRTAQGLSDQRISLEHGYIDRIVSRGDLKTEIARTIDYCGRSRRAVCSAPTCITTRMLRTRHWFQPYSCAHRACSLSRRLLK